MFPSGSPARADAVIDVDVLGQIFEQCITDLERLRQNLEQPGEIVGQCVPPALSSATPGRGAGETHCPTLEPGRRRQQDGAVYTPAFITRYLVEQELGGVLKHRFDTLRLQHEADAAGTARKSLADPNAYDPTALNEQGASVLTIDASGRCC